MEATKIYSQRLGAITDAQFVAVAERLNLGRFLKAEPITSGLFGQNVFMTTSAGQFVLRGAPHWVRGPNETEWRREDRWQFTKERWFAQQLHEKTRAPVPWPMLHDETGDIFGWPYLVMPRMPGRCFEEREILTALPAEDGRSVATALGEMLAEMQTLTAPFAGDFDIDTIDLTPYPHGHLPHVIAQTRRNLAEAQAKGLMPAGTIAWIEAAAERALAAGTRPNTFLHCDYKLNNLTVSQSGAGWRVSGLFDLHEAQFGDGALDIVRQACSYLDTDPELAGVFVESYLSRVAPDPRLQDLMPPYVINDRMKFWGFFVDRERGIFEGWVKRHVDKVMTLLKMPA